MAQSAAGLVDNAGSRLDSRQHTPRKDNIVNLIEAIYIASRMPEVSTTQLLNNPACVQCTLKSGTVVSINYERSARYTNIPDNAEVMVWTKNNRTVTGGKFRLGRDSGVVYHFPMDDIPALILHLARYVR